jgi:hypothetical protein
MAILECRSANNKPTALQAGQVKTKSTLTRLVTQAAPLEEGVSGHPGKRR